MNIFSYDQLRQIVDATVPNHLVAIVDGSHRYDYTNAVAKICAAFNQPADGWIVPFIEVIVVDAVEDLYGAHLPDVASVSCAAMNWGSNWLARWISTPPVRNRTALVTTADSYDDPIVIMAHFDTATGWRSVCDSRPITVTHWMALPPLPLGVFPRWARLAEKETP